MTAGVAGMEAVLVELGRQAGHTFEPARQPCDANTTWLRSEFVECRSVASYRIDQQGGTTHWRCSLHAMGALSSLPKYAQVTVTHLRAPWGDYR